MNNFEGELRARLERASSGIEPSTVARAATLRRARRKRTLHTVLAGGVGVLVAAGVLFAADLGGDGRTGSVEVSGSEKRLSVPDGSVKVAEGNQGGEAWLLARSYEDDCFSLTTQVAAGDVCAAAKGVLHVHDIPSGEGRLVYGDLSPKVVDVELRISGGGKNEFLPVEILPAPEAIRDGPPEVRSARRYFVSYINEDAFLTVVVAEQVDGTKASQIVGPAGMTFGVATAQELIECPATFSTSEQRLADRVKGLSTKIERPQHGSSSRKQGAKFEHYDVTMSCPTPSATETVTARP